MNLDSIEAREMFSKLRLTEEELVEYILPRELWNPVNMFNFYLIGRVVSKKVISEAAFTAAMSRAMNPLMGLSISMIGENKFHLVFYHAADRNSALEGSPWHFDGRIVIIGETDSDDLDLNWCNFYIHVLDLPPRCMTYGIATFIGNKIGKFLEMDTSSYKPTLTLGIKVQIDVSKPLIRLIKLGMDNGVVCVVPITYEKLPKFCYFCGKLGHTIKGCDIREHMGRNGGDWPYGSWLRAERIGLNKWPQETQEEAQSSCSTSSSIGGASSSTGGTRRIGRKEKLIICFSLFMGSKDCMSVNYSFEAFPIKKLTARSSTAHKQIKPKEKFSWGQIVTPSRSGYSEINNVNSGFIHLGDSVYYVSGSKEGLFRNLSCISLSTPLQNSQEEVKCPMRGVKYHPLVEEINGLIYVLSRTHEWIYYGRVGDYIGFEVYDPVANTWTALPAPPFLDAVKNCGRIERLAHLVIGSKLCVSIENYSSCYDVMLKKWEACELFSDFVTPAPPDYRKLPIYGCGPPFPFHKKAIPYKDNIFLCVTADLDLYSLWAFWIMNGKKAVKVPLCFNEWPSGCDVLDLVHLGDDFFVLLVLEKLEDDEDYRGYGIDDRKRDYVTMMVFKLVFEEGADGHGAFNCILVSRTTRFTKVDAHTGWNHVYSFKTAT